MVIVGGMIVGFECLSLKVLDGIGARFEAERVGRLNEVLVSYMLGRRRLEACWACS